MYGARWWPSIAFNVTSHEGFEPRIIVIKAWGDWTLPPPHINLMFLLGNRKRAI